MYHFYDYVELFTFNRKEQNRIWKKKKKEKKRKEKKRKKIVRPWYLSPHHFQLALSPNISCPLSTVPFNKSDKKHKEN